MTHITSIDELISHHDDTVWNTFLEPGRYKEESESYHKKKKIEYKDTAASNAKNEYYRALNMLLDYNFEIYYIEKKLGNFKNRRWSACISGTETFLFHCKKNNYIFMVVFVDDCDCEPGILAVSDVKHFPTNTNINIKCDLYGQSDSVIHIRDFLTLLECDNLDEYYNERFGALSKILEELGKRSYETSMSKNKFDKVNLNTYSYDFFYTVKTQNGNCILIPRSSFGEQEYVISICLPFEEKTRIIYPG